MTVFEPCWIIFIRSSLRVTSLRSVKLLNHLMSIFLQKVARNSRGIQTSIEFLKPCVIALGFSILIIACGLISTENNIFRTWLSSLSAFGIIWIYVLQCYGGRLPLRSNVLVMLGFSASNLVPPLYLSVRLHSEPCLDTYYVADMYPLVALMTTIGALALLFGYELVDRKFRAGIPSRLSWGLLSAYRVMPIMVIIAGVIWVARGILLVSGGYYWVYVNPDFVFGRWGSVIGTISDFGLIVPIGFWLLAGKNPLWRPWAWLATGVELIWVLPSGARETFIETLFGLLLVFWWCKQRFPWRGMMALLVAAIIAVPIMGEYRYSIASFTDVNRVSISSSVAAARVAREHFVLSSGRTSLGFLDNFANRLYDGQHLGYLLKHYSEDYDWEYGATYYTRLPFLLLPYFIYPHRPIMSVPLDHWYKLVLGGSSPTTFLGEAYINFGYLGIPIMGFLIGMILAGYDAVFLRRQNDFFAVMVYLFFASQMPRMVSASLASWMGNLRNAILALIVFYLVRCFLGGRRSNLTREP